MALQFVLGDDESNRTPIDPPSLPIRMVVRIEPSGKIRMGDRLVAVEQVLEEATRYPSPEYVVTVDIATDGNVAHPVFDHLRDSLRGNQIPHRVLID